MRNLLIATFILFPFLINAQNEEFISEDLTINKFVDGTLLSSTNEEDLPLVIIIPGSGPTDRNGNQNFLNNNSLKKLAEGLAENKIASFRMDKRIVKQIKRGDYSIDILFDDFVTDVKSVIEHISTKRNFKSIYVLGHSQGSLVGMLAINENVDGFISVAGAGRPIDEVLVEQVAKTAPGLKDATRRILDVLKEGNTTDDYPQVLASFLNKDVQPFMISWIKHNPGQIISELEIPILIINGTKDLQVSEEEARLLSEASRDSSLAIIEKMNHVLFIIEGDALVNSKSYNEPQREISKELVTSIVEFVND